MDYSKKPYKCRICKKNFKDEDTIRFWNSEMELTIYCKKCHKKIINGTKNARINN